MRRFHPLAIGALLGICVAAPASMQTRVAAVDQRIVAPYDQPFLTAIATRVREHDANVWCLFDNTGSGGAFENAVRMSDLLNLRPLH